MPRTKRSGWLWTLALIGALALAGCGGDDDGNNIEQDLRDQIAMLEGDLSAAQAAAAEAMAAQEAAEAAQAAAEMAQMEAEAAQAEAETERDEANVALGVAQQARMTAEEAAAAAAMAQEAAEAAQATAEAERDTANADAAAATAAQMEAEAAEAAALAAQMEAEANAAAAMAAQMAAEADAAEAMAAQMAAEASEAEAIARRDMAIAEEVRAQHARDMALADLAAANLVVEALTGEVEALNTSIMGLNGQLETATDNAAKLQEDLDKANDTIAALTADGDTLASDLAKARADAEKLTADLAMANGEVKRLEGELAIAVQAKDDAEANLITAVEDKVKAETARDNALKAQSDAEKERDEAQAALETAQSDLAAAIERAEDAEEERDNLRARLDEEEEEEREQEDNQAEVDRATGIIAAMMDRNDSAPDVEVEYDGGVKIDVDDIDGTGTAPPAINGYTARTFTHDRPDPIGGSDAVYVYTDIKGPEAMEFGDVHLQGDPAPTTVGLGTTSGNPGMASLARSPMFPSSDATTRSFNDGDSVDGTYDGVAGDFDCGGGAACTVVAAVDSKGKVTLTFTGEWTFEPDDAEDTVMVDDADFLTFGFWLYKPDEADYPHFFDTFVMGSQAFTAAVPTDLTGTSTYRGNAAGKYVTRNLVEETAEIGLFTAKARLTANFTNAEVSGLATSNITGAITDFVAGDGTELDGWSVTLNAAATAASTDATDPVSLDGTPTTSAMIGGSPAGAGVWAADFFGTGRNDGAPGSVAGTFDAFGGPSPETPNFAVSGAFGAHNVTPDTN